MMSALCRTACLRALPLARGPLQRTAQLRQMSASSAPGSSTGMIYYAFVVAAAAGGGVYVYRTLSRDRARFQERRAYLESSPQEWSPKPMPPKADGEDPETSEASEVSEEVEEAVTVEALAVNADEVVAQIPSTTELEHQEEDEPAVDITSSSADQEVTPQEESNILEDAPVQEIVASEAEFSSAPEEKIESIGTGSTPAEDLSELSFRKPETDSKESIQISEESPGSTQ